MSTSTRSRILITLATYNEIENLPSLVEEIFSFVPQVDILIIDDNSPDGTGEWCDRKAASDQRVHCLHRTGKLGLGSAIVAGLRYAIDQRYDHVLNMDADFSHHPRHLPAILAGIQQERDGWQVDVMIGSRYVAGGRIEGWPLRRHFMSRAVNCYARWMLGLKSKDCSGSYRCYRVSRLAQVDFGAVRSRGYSFQEEILWHLKRVGANFCETPITFADRLKGRSKINAREAWGALGVIFALAARRLFSARPVAGVVTHRATATSRESPKPG